MQRSLIALAALLFVLLYSGCGQSGPLYLPGDPSRMESVPPAPVDAEDEDKQEDEAPES